MSRLFLETAASVRRAVRGAWAAALAAQLSLAACAPRMEPEAPAPTELRVPLARDVRSLDPLDAGDVVSNNVVRQLYEGLVDYDPRTLQVRPRLASAWSVSADGLEWTFAVRAGVRFLDDPCFTGGRGRSLDGEDARYAIERALRHAGPPVDRTDLPPVAGLADFMAGRSSRLAGVTVPAPLRLRVRLARPDPGLLHFLAQGRTRLVPREAVETYGDGLRERAVGTGPFRLVSWEPLSGILLARNRDYWGRDPRGERLPYVDALRFVPYGTGDEHRLFAEGGLHMTYHYLAPGDPAGGDAAAATDTATGGRDGPGAAPRRYFVSRLNTVFARFDFRSRHLACRDPRLRLAVSRAAPRLRGTAHVAARGLFPPGLPGFDPEAPGQARDPEGAARLLDEAGHPGGRGLRPLRIAWPEWDLGVARLVAGGLERANIPVVLLALPDPQYRDVVRAGGADLFRDGWMADYPDPVNFLQLFYSKSPDNRGAYRDARFDAGFEALCAEPDSARRVRLARRLERRLVNEAAAVFLHHERESQLVSARVEGWEGNCTNPLNVGWYERVRLRPAAGGRP